MDKHGLTADNIFIVILNWNRKDETLECLSSVGKLATDGLQLSVVVVDNGSTESGTDEIGKVKLENAKIKLIKNEKNLGFTGGNNVGMTYALANGADFILLLNNDTVVDKNLIQDLVKVAHKHKNAGALSPKIYFAPGFEFHKERYKNSERGKVIWYAGGDIDWDNVYGPNRGVDEVDRGQFDKVVETDFATGAAMFLRREAVKDAGMFNDRYFMYLEDVDLSVRMKKRGWKVLYAPPAHLWHKVARSSAIGGGANDYYIIRNRLLFGMLYARIRTKLALLRQSLRILVTGPKWQRRGVIDFYLGHFGKGSFKAN